MIRSCCFQTFQKKIAFHWQVRELTLSYLWEALTCSSLIIQKIPRTVFILVPCMAPYSLCMEFNLLLLMEKHCSQFCPLHSGRYHPASQIAHPIVSTCAPYFMLYPHLECASKVSLRRYQARKSFQLFCIKPRVPAITTTRYILKHMYIMNFIQRPCLQKEEQTDWIHCSILILIVAIIWSVSNQLISI